MISPENASLKSFVSFLTKRKFFCPLVEKVMTFALLLPLCLFLFWNFINSYRIFSKHIIDVIEVLDSFS